MWRVELRTLVFLFAVPLALVTAFLLYRRQVPPNLHYKQQAEVAKKWRSLAFTEIEDSVEFLVKVNNINGLTNSGLSEAQVADLHESVYNLLVALKTGAYDAYRRFRTPVPAAIDPVVLNERRKAVAAEPGPVQALPEDPEEFLKLYASWLNYGEGFTNCWLAVALDDAVVRVAELSSATNELSGWAWSQDNLGLVWLVPVFVFDTTPQRVLQREGKLLVATLSMVIRPRKPDPEYLVHLRCFWDDASQHWIPWEYARAYSDKCKCELMW